VTDVQGPAHVQDNVGVLVLVESENFGSFGRPPFRAGPGDCSVYFTAGGAVPQGLKVRYEGGYLVSDPRELAYARGLRAGAVVRFRGKLQDFRVFADKEKVWFVVGFGEARLVF
jgi:hypothetical protein